MSWERLYDSLKEETYEIPSGEDIKNITKEMWIETPPPCLRDCNVPERISLILDLDVNDPNKVKSFSLKSENWKEYLIDQTLINNTRQFKLLIRDGIDKERFNDCTKLQIRIVLGAFLDSIFAIIDWTQEIDITDYELA